MIRAIKYLFIILIIGITSILSALVILQSQGIVYPGEEAIDPLIQRQEENNIRLLVLERQLNGDPLPLVDPIDCVVLIETGMGLGSGVVISEDGIILTAGHMIAYGEVQKVIFRDGTEWTEFELAYMDEDTDIGLFKIKEAFQFPYLPLGDSNELEIGEEIWAIGMPFGEEWWHCYGYVSKESEKGRLFMSMPLNPGNSGCPILNCENEVVGICTDGILPGNNIARGYTSNICSAIIAKYRILFEL